MRLLHSPEHGCSQWPRFAGEETAQVHELPGAPRAAHACWKPWPLEPSRRGALGLPRAGHTARGPGGGLPRAPTVCPAAGSRGVHHSALRRADPSSLWVETSTRPATPPAWETSQLLGRRRRHGTVPRATSLSFQPDPTGAPLSAKAAEAGLQRSWRGPQAATHCPGCWPRASVSLQTQQTRTQRNRTNWCQRPS